MFKRMHVDDDHYTFISLNPIYPPLTLDKAKIERILPVGGGMPPNFEPLTMRDLVGFMVRVGLVVRRCFAAAGA
jgi:hypothetical protein